MAVRIITIMQVGSMKKALTMFDVYHELCKIQERIEGDRYTWENIEALKTKIEL
jgi:hypothetical protein